MTGYPLTALMLASPASPPMLDGTVPVATAPSGPDVARLAQVLKHRLSSLTSSIEGYTDLLADTLGSPDQRDLAFRIFESVRGIDQVLVDLDVVSSCPPPVCAPVDPERLTDQLVAALGSDSSRLVFDLEASAPLELDADLMLRALLALTRNGLEASKQTVLLHLHREGGVVRFDVWNAGSLSDAPDELFRLFYTTKSRHLGLGLPYARRIAQAHGGSLGVHVQGGVRGTCFRMTLPGM
jgi:signal transduction histidine kinase